MNNTLIRHDNLTQHLRAHAGGDRRAIERVLPCLYAELRRIAGRQLRGRHAGNTLQATALVHEAYLRLVGQRVNWANREHFLGVAACLMRRIVIDYARARCAAKRGGDGCRVTLDESVLAGAIDVPDEGRARELLAIDAALDRLQARAPRQAKVVELRYFGGLSIEEAAEALDISPATVKREWLTARAFLHRELVEE